MNDENSDRGDDSAIAIIGMACHLPGAQDLETYWDNLRKGVESVRFFTAEELLAAGESPALLADPNYVRAQPRLENFAHFDAAFWGFSPQDAAVTDPAHRIFLETAYAALENAGHTGHDDEGVVGVFAASGASLYWKDNLETNPDLIAEMGEFLVRHTGNDMNFLATRLSYELDLRGPSVNIQTACSSALVCVHMAAQSLLSGECDIAIAGASTVLLPQDRGYLFKTSEIMSPDGHCRPFDENSAGTIFGSGTGSVILRRLDDALADGDRICAVIRGSAINNDGSRKIGYLAPGVDGQARAIAEALHLSGVDARDVGYIEAHGTGTKVGDPIEFEALNQVFRGETDDRGFCRIGSVKSNIGHLGEAAGAAAIIKVALALQHQQIPPTLNYTRPNPEIDLQDSPFVINDQLVPWVTDGRPRIAGITALGAGGTNAHVIVEQAPAREPSAPSKHKTVLLVLSAKSKASLGAAARKLAACLREQPDLDLADVAYTLQLGRRSHDYRRALACSNHADALAQLLGAGTERLIEAKAVDPAPSLVFMFPGGGAQYAGMGGDLYREHPVYRAAFGECLQALEPEFATEIRELVFAQADAQAAAQKTLERPSRTLPALFATEYALARLLMHWGATPTAFIGHSMGEYTAACLAGVFSVRDAMHLVQTRGRLFETVPRGGMLSISLAHDQAKLHMPESLDIAAVNAPELCVASGPVADIESLQAKLEALDIDCSRVRIDIAAHSSMLAGILEQFRVVCRRIQFSPPTLPFTSNLTGGWITAEQATDPNYWVEHLRGTVLFAQNVATATAGDPRVLVEIGPGRTLTNLARACESPARAVFNSMRHPQEQDSDVEFGLRTLGSIWTHGVRVDWNQIWGDERRHRVALPSYQFERKVYWVDPGSRSLAADRLSSELKKRTAMSEWFAYQSWRQACLPTQSTQTGETWLVFVDDVGLSPLVCAELLAGPTPRARSITTVRRGSRFSRETQHAYVANPDDPDTFDELFRALQDAGETPQHVVYMWPTSSDTAAESNTHDGLDRLCAQLSPCFWGLFHLAKSLVELDSPVQLTVVSSDVHNIGDQNSQPEKALLLGPVLVLPHESPQIQTRSIDLGLAGRYPAKLEKIASHVVAELCSTIDDRVVAYRGSDRWVCRVEPAQLELQTTRPPWLRKAATVLITGGLGGIGLHIARHLAQLGAGQLVLVGRSRLPPREQWPQWLDQHHPDDQAATRIRQMQEIEGLGAKVMAISADVTDLDAMTRAITSAQTAVGAIHGVIHAAGSMDDHLIVLKSRASAQAVLAAKVMGAAVLDRIFPDDRLDFFVVFSSVAAFLGLPGQVDYAAANAYLDAFARERSQRASGHTLAINWNAWRDAGMAASALAARHGRGQASGELVTERHSAIDYSAEVSARKRVFSSKLSAQHSWLVSEHRTARGQAVLPGTGFIELIREAAARHMQLAQTTDEPAILELFDVQLLAAFIVPDSGERILNIAVEGDPDEVALVLYSDSEDMPHVTASARRLSGVARTRLDLPAVRARCPKRQPTRGGHLDQDFMNFGPRWGCITAIMHDAVGEALVELTLPGEFVADLQDYRLHPAILDMATGGCQFLIAGFSATRDFYVPVAYERATVFGPMPAHCFCNIRICDDVAPGFARFDLQLSHACGEVFADIEGFTMKRLDGGFTADPSHSQLENLDADPLAEILREAILPDEGVRAFDIVMGRAERSQWIVSSVDTQLWHRQLDRANNLEDAQAANRPRFVREIVHDPDADPDIPRIEQLLAGHPAISAAIVRSHLQEDGGRRLIAHFIRDQWGQATVSELRSFVKSELPEELVPQHYIEIDELPEDADGKLQRSLLLDPFAPQDDFVAPDTATQKALAGLWQQVLGVERVSLHDNYFDLGGHSLTSARIIVRAKKQFGFKIDQAKMVMMTLEQIAGDIDARRAESASAVGPEPTPTRPPSNTDDASSDGDKPRPRGLIRSLFGKK